MSKIVLVVTDAAETVHHFCAVTVSSGALRPLASVFRNLEDSQHYGRALIIMNSLDTRFVSESHEFEAVYPGARRNVVVGNTGSWRNRFDNLTPVRLGRQFSYIRLSPGQLRAFQKARF